MVGNFIMTICTLTAVVFGSQHGSWIVVPLIACASSFGYAMSRSWHIGMIFERATTAEKLQYGVTVYITQTIGVALLFGFGWLVGLVV